MTASITAHYAALLAALKAIVGECRGKPGERPYDPDSYLPAHFLDDAQRTIDAIEAPIKKKARAIEVARFPTLKAEFAKHGHILRSTAGLAPDVNEGMPIGYFAYREGLGLARYLPTLEDAENFLIQMGGAA